MSIDHQAPRGRTGRAHAHDDARRDAAARLGIDVKLLELLVCPLGGAPLAVDPETDALVSRKARLAYPVRDGVPILTPAEATPIDEHDPRLHPRPRD